MDLFDTTQLGLERAISGSAQRHAALAGNLANANTPGYAPRDVDFHGALRAAFESGRDAVASATFTATSEPGVMRADGSGVDVDVTAAKLAENGLDYEALVSAARARIDILESAMGTR
jgi:flagellar basal-body rod protein FlgB